MNDGLDNQPSLGSPGGPRRPRVVLLSVLVLGAVAVGVGTAWVVSGGGGDAGPAQVTTSTVPGVTPVLKPVGASISGRYNHPRPVGKQLRLVRVTKDGESVVGVSSLGSDGSFVFAELQAGVYRVLGPENDSDTITLGKTTHAKVTIDGVLGTRTSNATR